LVSYTPPSSLHHPLFHTYHIHYSIIGEECAPYEDALDIPRVEKMELEDKLAALEDENNAATETMESTVIY